MILDVWNFDTSELFQRRLSKKIREKIQAIKEIVFIRLTLAKSFLSHQYLA